LKYIEIPGLKQNFSTNETSHFSAEVHTSNCEFYLIIVFKNRKFSQSVDWIRDNLEAVSNDHKKYCRYEKLGNDGLWTNIACLRSFEMSENVVRKALTKEIAPFDGKVNEVNLNILLIANEIYPLTIADVMSGEAKNILARTFKSLITLPKFMMPSIFFQHTQ
jgi:hypothetical protein